MVENENDSEANLSDVKSFGRRKMLAALSIVGLSTVSLGVFAAKGNGGKAGKKGSLFVFGSVAEMKEDNSLKEGDQAHTSGFYDAGDGGGAAYLIIKTKEKVDEGELISLNNGLTAKLINVAQVNYRVFGAKSDGKSDDGVQIRKAHNYANKNNLPVSNLSGDFWITESNHIRIQTDVNWGNSIFHINEKYNTSTSRFVIESKEESRRITLTDLEKQSFLKQLKSKTRNIAELTDYANSLVVIIDSNQKAGARQGGNATAGKSQQDFFYVETDGRVMGEVFLEFSDYTSLTAYPAEKSYLTMEGGTFFLSGQGPDEQSGKYMANGIQIQRSRTILKNQWLGIEQGNKDIARRPRSGFYNLSRVFDVQLENIRLLPWEKTRGGDKLLNVPQGTYGISGSVMMNVVFKNITAEAGKIHWGIFGTNYVKNLRVERCFLNRFDVHSFGWNITIVDSEFGQKGVTVTGGGELRVENTSAYQNNFISFRPDYGSRWDGDIVIKNCKLYPIHQGSSAIISYNAKDLDYKYAIGYAANIKIEDFIIDYRSVPESTAICWVISTVVVSSYLNSGKLFFPSTVEMKNITVRGREKGVRIMNLAKPNTFSLEKDFVDNSFYLHPNARLIFDNIDLEESSIDSPQFSIAKQDEKLHKKALVPLIRFKDCKNVICKLENNLAEIEFENCSISNLLLGEGNSYHGSLIFKECKFVPASDQVSFNLGATLGTTFVNCILMLPKTMGDSKANPLKTYSFIQLNKSVKYNHTNTRLGLDILAHLKHNGTVLLPDFISKLKANHELE
ncbi:hypothetical protein [Pedobacter arcticus]|uniref:hypothetical protein n=1 Tax=Pedobacter arcticus TaxID=752140 RepID=UPI0002D8101B|nr:hypothetical protein [Pedobacter arcticus]